MSVQPWHQSVWHELVRRQQSGGLPHALLLTGLEGIGKHQLGLHVAQWLCYVCAMRLNPVASATVVSSGRQGRIPILCCVSRKMVVARSVLMRSVR